MTMKIQIVLNNSDAGELGRYDVELDEMGDIDLPALCRANEDLCLAMEILAVGDTITIEEVE
jgi:hypothetical protein